MSVNQTNHTLIFDFDGTIADSFEYVFRFLREEVGLPADFTALEAAAYKEMSMHRIARGLGVPRWRLPMVYFKGRRVMRKHLQHVEPFHGMPELIKQLHKNGTKMYIVSANSAHNIQKFLKSHKMNKYFSGVKGNAGVWGKGPLLRRLIEQHCIDRENCWLIGDEVSDMFAARAVGIHSIAVAWGFSDKNALLAAADKVVMNPEDIPKLIY